MSENEGRRGDADGGDEIKVEDRRRIDPRTGDARGADEVPLPGGGVLRGAEDEAAVAAGVRRLEAEDDDVGRRGEHGGDEDNGCHEHLR